MPRAYISIGSNVNAEDNIGAAIVALKKRYGDLTLSTVYKNKAVGFDGDDFLNLVVGLETEQSIIDFVEHLHCIEAAQGRARNIEKKFSSRTLDMDLLLYGNDVFYSDNISIPRDEIIRYAFVLQPLFELVPDYYHPTEKCTIAQLWSSFDKQGLTMTPVELVTL
ncbi:2-amino-4-hydroxy-6-hydroxymethyldihydropteridinepyrophosphokinase [hydrothermal vent metagenome]|uniref:2-amino-4-hydroxy-6-hydroxymethyldihydropteridine diphosphokinase n=1 Tax=hydrothermal vent metagenome TaxID=652676 RepID=A0A3B1AEV8_9ZZZZ